ncbi:MAG: CAP domain-containing protein [Chloroflexota bacterium]
MVKAIFRLFYISFFLVTIVAGGYMFLLLTDRIGTDNAITNVADLNPNATAIPVTLRAITPETHPNSQTFADILSDLNAMRERRGLPLLQYDTRLHRAAAVQVAYNTTLDGRLSHTGANGSDAADRVEAQGYQWSTVAENLLFNYSLNGSATYRQWRNSPPHFTNMRNPDVTEVGLAYMVTDIGQVYYAMVLASPR